ncbi:MAG: alpha/beta hydrolase [Acidimicrobiia bacterium]
MAAHRRRRTLLAALLALAGPSILPGCRTGDPVDATAAATAGSGAVATIPSTEPPPAGGGTGPAPDGAPDHGTDAVLDPPVAPLEWRGCGDGFECATLEVPWDGGIAAAEPTAPGRSMQLPVIRLPHRGGGAPLGSVVLNPGGPGASGVRFLRAAAGAPALVELNQRFDLVGFDPRGVGGAVPALRCRDDLDDGIDVLGPGGTPPDTFRDELLAFHRRCAGDNAELVAVLGTDYAAADLDHLRAALGDERLTYLGFSYGTRLGAAYAERFPARMRALALDGADVSAEEYLDSIAAQYVAFDDAFERFAATCPDDDDGGRCATSDAGGAAAAFRSVQAALSGGSLPTDEAGRRLTAGELYLGAAAALYDRSSWPALDAALDAAAGGDGSGLQTLADSLLDRRPDGTYANLFDANIAVNCADTPQRPTFDEALERGAALAATLRWFGPLAGTAYVDCVEWPAPAPVADVAEAGAPAPIGDRPPVLVVGTTGDTATPYAWAQRLAASLPTGVLLTRVGEGHTAYFASDCTAALINDYLIDPAGFPLRPPTCDG